MTEEIIIEEKLIPQKPAEKESAQFKGYTIAQLRYRRAMVAVKKEYALEELRNERHKFSSISNFSGKFGSVAKTVSNTAPILSKIFRGLSYMDYITMGISLFGGARKIVNRFRKKKK